MRLPRGRGALLTISVELRPAQEHGRQRLALLERDLRAQEPFGERVVDVLHQIHEHVVRLMLVLDERIFLTPGAVADRVAQLVEIVEVILPLLVEDVQHHQREQLVGVLAEARQFVGERLAPRFDRALSRFLFAGWQ